VYFFYIIKTIDVKAYSYNRKEIASK